MSGKIGGPSESSGEEQRRVQAQQQKKIEKIEKLSETDPDQRARKRKFDQFMQKDEASKAKKEGPTPFEPSFHKKQNFESASANLFTPPQTTSPELIDLEDSAVPSPSYSPAPNLSQTPPETTSHEPTTSHLPSSSSFLQGPANAHHTEKQTSPHPSEKKTHDKNTKAQDLKMKENQEKLSLQAQRETKKQKKIEEEKKKKQAPIASIYQPHKEKEIASRDEKKTSKGKEAHLKTITEEQDLPSQKQKQLHEELPPEIAFKEITRKEKHTKESHQTIETPIQISTTTTAIPLDAIRFAETATVNGAHYLSEHIASLYFNMVGAIYAQRSSGISTTEIVLNSPALANSKFFGAKIILEKYDTDPNSFNIRLTGTNEAVTLFNQNLPNLYAAFQNAKFNFRIGRIEAEYSTEKPIFQRKESAKGRDFNDEGGGFDQNKGSSQ